MPSDMFHFTVGFAIGVGTVGSVCLARWWLFKARWLG